MKLFGLELKFNDFDIWHKGNLTKVSDLTNDSGYISEVPVASDSILGGIKVGSNLSVTEDGTLSANSNASSYIRKQETFYANAGQTVFNLTTGYYSTGINAIDVYINGYKQPKEAYYESTQTTITVDSDFGFEGGEQVIIEYLQLINISPYPIHADLHLTGGDDAIPLATTTTDGLLGHDDKAKIDKILSTSMAMSIALG